MSRFVIIPKILKPRKGSTQYNQRIPKIIWQTISTNKVPAYMKTFADSWIDLNPEYEYRFFDDNDILKFLKTDFPEYLHGYNQLKYGASKADLWRYLIIYKYGGVYADLDCKCLNSLRTWIDPTASFVTQLGINKDICQWLIISEAGNPAFLKAAQQTLINSETDNCHTTHYGFQMSEGKLVLGDKLLFFDHPVIGLSGPPVLQKAAEECYKNGSWNSILPHIQITCVSDPINSCHMNNNVIHDTQNIEYKKAYGELKLTHYNSRTEKIKRKIRHIFSFGLENRMLKMPAIYRKVKRKLFYKQWMIGFYEGSISQIIASKKFKPKIKWIEPNSIKQFSADPFLISVNKEKIKVLFEEFVLNKGYGTINLLTLNKDFEPTETKVLLDTHSHLSYPFIFEENGSYYVFPEARQSGKLSCYLFDPVKEELLFEKDILELPLLDSTIVKHNQKYWLFGATGDNSYHYQLHLFFAENLLGPYQPHELNPIRQGLNGTRSAGNFIRVDQELYWPTQNCEKKYGDSITFNKIKTLTEKEFKDEPVLTISIDQLNNNKRVSSIHTINELGNLIVLDAQRWSFSPYGQLCKFYRDNFKKSKKIKSWK